MMLLSKPKDEATKKEDMDLEDSAIVRSVSLAAAKLACATGWHHR